MWVFRCSCSSTAAGWDIKISFPTCHKFSVSLSLISTFSSLLFLSFIFHLVISALTYFNSFYWKEEKNLSFIVYRPQSSPRVQAKGPVGCSLVVTRASVALEVLGSTSVGVNFLGFNDVCAFSGRRCSR